MSSVVERINAYTRKEFSTENIRHLVPIDTVVVPGSRAYCGAKLKGIDHGCIPYDQNTCVVCIEISRTQP